MTKHNSGLPGGPFNDIRDVVMVAVDRKIREIHGPFESVFGFSASTGVRSPVLEILSAVEGDYEQLLDEATRRQGEVVRSSVRLLVANDKTMWVEVAVRDASGARSGLFQKRRAHVVTVRDRTAETELRLQISRLGATDPVTDLPNAVRFRELLRTAMARSVRSGDHLAVLSIGFEAVDALRAVFDPSGISSIRRELAHRISQTLREEDIVGHLEADEFGVVLSGMEWNIGRAYAVDVADRIADRLAEPLNVDGTFTNVTAHIGIAHGTRGKVETNAADLIHDAKSARSEVEANADRWKNLKNPS